MHGFYLLCRVRLQALLHLPEILREQSRFKVVFVVLFAGGLLAGLWMLFGEGFRFLDRLGGIGLFLVPRLFAVFFLGLGLMLTVSSLVTTYATLYRSEETPALLLQPLSRSAILLFKYAESAFYASWAFFFIIVPFVGAYGAYEKLPWHFSVWTLLFAVPFVVVHAGVGYLATVIGVRWIPRRSRRWLAAGAVAAVLAAGWAMARVGRAAPSEAVFLLKEFVPGLQLASHPLLPSWWIAEGLISISRGQWLRGGLLWATLLANAMLVSLLAERVGARWFYEGWQRTVAGAGRVARRSLLGPGLERVLGFLPRDWRCMMLKDLRLFVRDPQQWMQALIFLGLLALYFSSLRNFRYHLLPPEWRNLIAFLNLLSTSGMLCSLGSRFVYPQMSLEGQAFWIIGMGPHSMGRVLALKFLTTWTTLALVSAGLMLVSVRMLNVDPPAGHVTLVLAVAVATVVAGLSLGLGAVFLDLRQRNPAAIVSGFGGTLNLVLSLVYTLLAVAPFVLLFHLRSVGYLPAPLFRAGLAAGAVALVLATTVFAGLPLWLGWRSLMQRDY